MTTNAERYETTQQMKTDQVIIRITPEDKKSLIQEAQKQGLSISAFIRMLLANWVNGKTIIKRQ